MGFVHLPDRRATMIVVILATVAAAALAARYPSGQGSSTITKRP
jgi:hypothetical protein